MVFWVLLGVQKWPFYFYWCGELKKWVCSARHVGANRISPHFVAVYDV